MNNLSIQKNPEILSPAGGFEHLVAAARSGADAVYLGTKNFNARKNAQNFGKDELKKAVEYCHERGMRLYVTLNTLIYDDEINDLIAEVEILADCGVDAVIVQDFAVARIIRDCVPTLPLHASTQMTIHNAAGAEMAAKLGFKRVVLARELELDEIRRIREQTDLELEVFVHGALCMSVSGTCYLSSMIGTRSGNRGNCAQPCRLNFKSGEREYVLSLKDLSLTEHVKDLINAGVDSFKIEGRMKRPEYVAMAVHSFSNALESREVDISTLKSVFSRGGFTDGYLLGKRDIKMFGYRKSEDEKASAKVLSSISELYRRERNSVPVFMDLNIHSDGRAELKVTDKVNTITETTLATVPEEAPLSEDYAKRSLLKTGGTPFFVKAFTLHNPANLFIFPGELKKLRREALFELSEQRAAVKPHAFTFNEYAYEDKGRHEEKELRIRFQKYEQFYDFEGAGYIILPLHEIKNHPQIIEEIGDMLIAEIPELLFEDDYNEAEKVLQALKEQGLKKAMAHNISAIKLIQGFSLEVFGGYGLNITNSLAALEYSNLGVSDLCLSFELSANRIKNMSGEFKRGVVSYGYLPLMKLRNCPAKTDEGCGDCSGLSQLTDRYKISFPLICERRRYSILLNSLPLHMADKNIEGIDFSLLYFTIESPDECRRICADFVEGLSPSGKATTGLFYREVE